MITAGLLPKKWPEIWNRGIEMLILRGILRSATVLGGGTSKKTGEVIPARPVLQIETIDGRGLVQMATITVPDVTMYAAKVGQEINLPVRAWAASGPVNFVYEEVRA